MEDAYLVGLAGKDAEISMLREQLAQLSSDLSRNLAVLSAKEAEAEEATNAVASLTAVLAEKDALFAQFEEQVAALEALRQKEAAECRQLHTVLESQRREWQHQLQTEQSKREKLQQQLQQLEESSAAEIQSARQAAATQAVQHSTQHKAELERATESQQQLQELQDVLGAKESELGAVQMQLAAALESAQRVQDNHGKSMASRNALVAEVQQQLEEVRAGNTRANKAHEAHIGQLISSINELQELCSKQAAELQQCSASQKAQQQELKGAQQAAKRHEEARSKAEMRKGAMEAALQQEVTAHAAAKAHNGLLQACVANLTADLQEQHSRAAAMVVQLSAQLSEAQEQMVCAAVSQPPSPQRAQVARTLEGRCQCLSADVRAAEERAACLAAICGQLLQQAAPLLTAASPAHLQQQAAVPASPAKAGVAQSPPRLLSCMDALTQSLQLQQQQQCEQQQQQQQQQPSSPWQACNQPAAPAIPSPAAASQLSCHCTPERAMGAFAGGSHRVCAVASPAGPQHTCTQAHPSGLFMQPGQAHVPCAAASPFIPRQRLQHNCEGDPQLQWQSLPQANTQGLYSSSSAAVPSLLPAAAPPSMLQLSGLVEQLQAGVACLQQQARASQQQLQQQIQLSGALPQPSASRGQAGAALQPQQGNPAPHQHHTHSKHHMCAEPGPVQQQLNSIRAARHYMGQQQHHQHQIEDEPALEESCSTCGSDNGSSTLSCSAGVAVAVSAARRRLQQQGSPCPTAGHRRQGRARTQAAGQGAARPSDAAALATLAGALRKKLEALSAETPAWC